MSPFYPNHSGSLLKMWIPGTSPDFMDQAPRVGSRNLPFEGTPRVILTQPAQHCIETCGWWSCGANVAPCSNQLKSSYSKGALVWNLALIQPSLLLLAFFQWLPGAFLHIKTRSLTTKGWKITGLSALKQRSPILARTGGDPAPNQQLQVTHMVITKAWSPKAKEAGGRRKKSPTV